jgi:DNA-binding transcriptional MocR family regulator
VAIAAGELGLVDSVISVALFTLISASTVLALVIAAMIRQEEITPWLTDLRTWLEANTKAMMSVLLVVVGVVEIGNGIGGIF